MFGARNVVADTLWDESIQGDLSNDYTNPTRLTFATGTNSIVGMVVGGDEDYVRADLPAGRKLTGLILQQYVSTDPIAFIGMERGPAFTFAPDDAFSHFNDLLGWDHIGASQQGVDILPEMGANAGTPVSPPFIGPSLTFWIQQLGASTNYKFDFIVSAPVLGDWNLDGSLNISDLSGMLKALTDLDAFKAANGVSDDDLLLIGDTDHSNSITNADIQAELDLLANGSLAAVPEPSAIVLGAIGFLGIPNVLGALTAILVPRRLRRVT
jgi:hypothetical protein